MQFKLNLKPDNSSDSEELKQFERQEVSIEELLIWCTTSGCSDLYIKEYDYPYISRFGKIIKIPCVPISKDTWMEFQDVYINNQMVDTYMVNRMLDTAIEVRIPQDNPFYGFNNEYYFRYRVSFGFSTNDRIATFRMIRPENPSFDSINYPKEVEKALHEAYRHKTGIVLFTGPTGSGKQLHKETKIPTINGVKLLEDIQAGDVVFDKNGMSTKVLDKYSPEETNFYEFTFSDGTKIKSGGGHLWEVEFLNQGVKTGDLESYRKFKANGVIFNLLKIKDRELTKQEFIKAAIKDTMITGDEISNFLSHFSEYLYHKEDRYIDIDKLIADCRTRGSDSRKEKLIAFKTIEKRNLISVKEAKRLLKSKFIYLIKRSGQEYISPQLAYVHGKELATAIIDWYNNKESLINCKTNKVDIITSNDIASYGVKNKNGRLNFAIRRPDACTFSKIELPIKPYWLGAWLGDGSKWEPQICGTDLEVGKKLNEDYPIRKTIIETPGKENYMPITSWHFDTEVRKLLINNNLRNNKHIPDVYKIASIEDKLELLAGLIDTDGSVNTFGTCGIGLTNKQIIIAMREICCSLGFKCFPIRKKQGAYTNQNGDRVPCKMVYSFDFYPTMMLPLQIPRKRDKLFNKLSKIENCNVSQQSRHKKFYITDIKKIIDNSKNYYCLAVDSPTHMFLCTESYIPTHNSTSLVACMNSFTQPGEILDNKVIISLEDPIEYSFRSTDSVKFNQKELGKDFLSYDLGIKQALREHPNLVNVGECRDRAVIQTTIEAARTGHLVTSSFHAGDVGGTIARLCFHLDNDINLVYDLIINLRIIAAQKLIPSDTGYIVDVQYLVFNDEITKRILEIVRAGDNISLEIEKIFNEQEIVELGLAKDWSYKL